MLDLVVDRLLDDDAAIVLAVDDTVHRRRGRKVDGAGYQITCPLKYTVQATRTAP